MAACDDAGGPRPGEEASRRPLAGVLVVALEQGVAAPYCSSRLAEAGARVIKIEWPEGDPARGCDTAVHGQSSCFVWINHGKQCITLDPKRADELALELMADAALPVLRIPQLPEIVARVLREEGGEADSARLADLTSQRKRLTQLYTDSYLQGVQLMSLDELHARLAPLDRDIAAL